jgi:hypothetical protein
MFLIRGLGVLTRTNTPWEPGSGTMPKPMFHRCFFFFHIFHLLEDFFGAILRDFFGLFLFGSINSPLSLCGINS